jgi:hypothetical protein
MLISPRVNSKEKRVIWYVLVVARPSYKGNSIGLSFRTPNPCRYLSNRATTTATATATATGARLLTVRAGTLLTALTREAAGRVTKFFPTEPRCGFTKLNRMHFFLGEAADSPTWKYCLYILEDR